MDLMALVGDPLGLVLHVLRIAAAVVAFSFALALLL